MNIYDIAKEAGVSIATISRVLNQSGSVSENTRNKVLKVLELHNYNPSAFARGMVTNSMKTIGVLAIDIRDIYYANVTYTIEKQLSEKGYNVILCNTGNGIENKKHYIQMLISKKIDGLILVGSVFKDEKLEYLIKSVAEKVPVILVNGSIKGDNIFGVVCDDSYGIRKCVQHLKSIEKQNIIFLKDTDTYSAIQKAEGFKSMMPSGQIFKVEKGLEGGYKGMMQIEKLGVQYDAIITSEDITSIGAMKYLLEIGKKVPEDVAVTGFNNSILSRCSQPELTTVDSMMEQIGDMSANILTDIIDGKKVISENIIRPKLIIRKSTLK